MTGKKNTNGPSPGAGIPGILTLGSFYGGGAVLKTAAETEEEEDSWEWTNEYHVFSFENGKFLKLASLDLEECGIPYGARGLYIGDTFYLAGGRRILAFDMKNGFEKIGEIR